MHTWSGGGGDPPFGPILQKEEEEEEFYPPTRRMCIKPHPHPNHVIMPQPHDLIRHRPVLICAKFQDCKWSGANWIQEFHFVPKWGVPTPLLTTCAYPPTDNFVRYRPLLICANFQVCRWSGSNVIQERNGA